MGVTLPNFTALGFRDPQAVGGQPSFPQESAVAAGQAALGVGLQKAGQGIETAAAYGQIARTKMDRAMADAHFFAQAGAIDAELKAETDPAKVTALGQRYREAVNTAAGAIGDPNARQMWLAEQERHVAVGQKGAELHNLGLWRDNYKAGVMAQGEAAVDTASKVGTPEAFELARHRVTALAESAKGSGAMTAVQALEFQDRANKLLEHGSAQNRIAGAALGALGMARGATAPVGDTGDLWGRIKGAEGGLGRSGEALTSPKGAIGISQILPDTARGVARDLGIPYDKDRLYSDQSYNETLGKAYLGQMLARYNGNEALAAAAYNAGPGRVDTWLKTIGDPTKAEITDAEFASKIPISETQSYVKRIISGRQNAAGELGAIQAAIPRVQPAPAAAGPQNRSGMPMAGDIWAGIQADPSLHNNQERMAAFNHAEQLYRVGEAQAAQSERLAVQQAHAQMAQAENDIFKDVYSANPSITPQQVAVDPRFAADPMKRRAMIELINNPPGSGVPAAQSAKAAQSLIERIRLPYGDPNKLTDSGEIYGNMRSLNRPDLEFVLKQFNDTSSPGGETLKQQRKDFIDKFKGFITESNPMAGKDDPLGDQRLYEFDRYVDEMIADAREHKKNPLTLFNPRSPDFLGSPEVIKPFTIPMADSQKAKSDWANGVRLPLPPVGSVAAPVSTPLPGGGAYAPIPSAVRGGAVMAPNPLAAPSLSGGGAMMRKPSETPAEYMRRHGLE